MYALNQEAGLSARPTLEDQIVPRLVQQSCCTALGPRNMKTAAAASVSAMCRLLPLLLFQPCVCSCALRPI